MVSFRCVLLFLFVFFIQINGFVFVFYNMGLQMFVFIGDYFIKVIDGNYYVVRVIRDGVVVTLQVDSNDVIRKDFISKCNKIYFGDIMYIYFILLMVLIFKISVFVVYIFFM